MCSTRVVLKQTLTSLHTVAMCFCVRICVLRVCLGNFRRGNEPSFGSAPRRMGGGRRVVEDASEEDADSQSDFNGTKSVE